MFKRVKEIIENRAIVFYILLTLFVLFILLWHDNRIGYKNLDWEGIWIEMHGMFFDIVILGLLLAIYDHFRDKKDRINRYNEEIDDYRLWNEQEATHRIRGNIRRLNKLGVTRINLDRCFLSNVIMINEELKYVSLRGTVLEYADLTGTSFYKSIIDNANFRNATLISTDFSSAKIETSNLSGCNFQNAKLNEAVFENCDMSECNLKFADLRQTSFVNVNLKNAKAYDYQKELLVKSGATIDEICFINNPDDFDIFKEFYLNGRAFEVYRMKISFNK